MENWQDQENQTNNQHLVLAEISIKFQGQMKTNNESVEETVLNSIHTTNDNNQDAEDNNDQSVSHMHDGIYTRSRLFTTATSSSAH